MNKDITTQLKNLFSKKRTVGKPGNDAFRPERDWEIIIGSFLLLNIALVGWSMYVFLSSGAPTVQSDSGVSVLPSISDRQKVADIIKEYQDKKLNEEKLIGSLPQISDPSL